MRSTGCTVAIITAGLMSGLVFGSAAKGEVSSQSRATFGGITYNLSCAVCHGLDGQGDGEMATELAVPAPDLTLLTKRNGGEFPTEFVTAIITGGNAVAMHGGQMPAWGLIFLKDLETLARDTPRDDAALVRRRIQDLVAYLQSIQVQGD